MFSLINYQPKIFKHTDKDDETNSFDFSKDFNALVFFLSNKNNCMLFEKQTNYCLENKTIEDLMNYFEIEMVLINSIYSEYGFDKCKFELNICSKEGKSFDFKMICDETEENENNYFCFEGVGPDFKWNGESGIHDKDNILLSY